MKVKTGLVTGGSERIAFSIVRVDVRYPDGIVGIVLQYDSSTIFKDPTFPSRILVPPSLRDALIR